MMDQDRPSDIVDRIDELVDQQLDGGEPHQGVDAGDPTFPRCPHCGRHWHGLPLTVRIAAMYYRGVFDESYRLDEDDSPVLCQGSDFIGPMPARYQPRPMLEQLPTGVNWLDDLIAHTNSLLADMGTDTQRPRRSRSRWQWWRLMATVFRRPRGAPPAVQRGFDAGQSWVPGAEDLVSLSMMQLSHEALEVIDRQRQGANEPDASSGSDRR